MRIGADKVVVHSRRESGAALLLMLTVLILAGVALFLSLQDSGRQGAAAGGIHNAKTLSQARYAIMASALADDNRPGSLPCPDNDGSGTAALFAGDQCPEYFFRLPHRTLDMVRPLDASGESLWYALDPAFRRQTANTNQSPLNPDTTSSITLNNQEGYAGVIIAPGPPAGAHQDDRDKSDEREQYLEAANRFNDDEFEDCTGILDCNDRVIGIRVDPLFHPVQRRVLSVIASALEDFHEDRGYLPRPADFGDPALQCRPDNRLGLIPLEAPVVGAESGEGECEGGEQLTKENFDRGEDFDWLQNNEWFQFVVYRLHDQCTHDIEQCEDGDLEIDEDGGFAAVLGGAGRTLTDQARGPGSDVSDYLDQMPNIDPDTEKYVGYPLSTDDDDPSKHNNDVFSGVRMVP